MERSYDDDKFDFQAGQQNNNNKDNKKDMVWLDVTLGKYGNKKKNVMTE